METVSYVVGVDVCVVPFQPIIQDGDDHSFSCDAFLPHGDHMQVQLWQGGRRPRVLLQDKMANSNICNSNQTRNDFQALQGSLRLFKHYRICEKGHPQSCLRLLH